MHRQKENRIKAPFVVLSLLPVFPLFHSTTLSSGFPVYRPWCTQSHCTCRGQSYGFSVWPEWEDVWCTMRWEQGTAPHLHEKSILTWSTGVPKHFLLSTILCISWFNIIVTIGIYSLKQHLHTVKIIIKSCLLLCFVRFTIFVGFSIQTITAPWKFHYSNNYQTNW